MKRLTIRSEYWITTGSKNDVGLLCADEDLPVPNHEGHVWDHMIYRLAEALGGTEIGRDAGMTDAWLEEYGCDIAMFHQDLGNALDRAGEHELSPLDFALSLLKLSPAEEKGWRGCLKASNQDDPREFAIKHWGWMRVRWHHADVPDVRSATMKRLAEGLKDIWEEEGNDPEALDLERCVEVSLYEGTRKRVTLNRLMDGWWSGDIVDHEDLTQAGKRAVDLLDALEIPEFYAGKTGG